jgi:hypothetical protein
MEWVPYSVVKGTNGKAMIGIPQDNGRTKLISPEEVSALILGKMTLWLQSRLTLMMDKGRLLWMLGE